LRNIFNNINTFGKEKGKKKNIRGRKRFLIKVLKEKEPRRLSNKTNLAWCEKVVNIKKSE